LRVSPLPLPSPKTVFIQKIAFLGREELFKFGVKISLYHKPFQNRLFFEKVWRSGKIIVLEQEMEETSFFFFCKKTVS